MAEKKENLDLAGIKGSEEGKSGSMKKIILIVVALVVIASGAGAAMFFMGGDESPEAAADGEVAAAEEVVEEEEEQEALYLPLDPPFVANANDPGSRRLMQVRMQVMSYDQAVIDKLKNNMALVRDAIIMLLSAQDFDKLGYPEEKQRLRGEIKQAIESSVKFPKGTQLEAVLFTEFIME